ncbi:MAG: amino acid adenylation domain-containing protein [Gemmatimonadota bacterium]
MTGSMEDEYPLTPLQQGMLYQWLAAPRSGVDVEQIVCTLREAVDVEALRRGWEGVARRHAVFRTSFAWRGLDEPVQRVHARIELPFAVRDWRDLDSDRREDRFRSFLCSDRTRGFDLGKAPCVRLALFRFGEAEYRLVWSFHHILLDGRSFPRVLAEVLDLGPEPAGMTSASFAQHVGRIAARDASRDEGFWTDYLRGFQRPTPVPGARDAAFAPARRRRTEGPAEVEEATLRLSRATSEALRERARESEVTLNTIVQAAWAILLSRYSGEADVLFGAARACRSSSIPEAESVVGMFINTLPVRARVHPEEPLVELLHRLRQGQVAVRDFEHTPLVEVQRWSRLPPGQPLFRSILIFDRASLDAVLRARGGRWRHRTFRQLELTGFPVTLYAYAEERLLLRLAYDTRVIPGRSGRRVLSHLAVTLEEIASRRGARVGELELLSDEERRKQLVDWNATAAKLPRGPGVHDLIRRRVELAPGAVAVVCGQQEWSYRELDSRAERLAQRLRSLGVGPEVRVGICIERSPEMLLGVLGVLKAGGAYVPLDPDYPEERLAFMVSDAKVAVMLASERTRERLPPTGAPLLLLDSPCPTGDARHPDGDASSGAPSVGALTSENLAYVIYTSGSTGQPKGVMVEHRNLLAFFAGMDGRVPHDPPGVWLAVTSLSFDISVLELLWTLARGFKIVLHAGPELGGELPLRGEPVSALIRRHAVTHLQCTPSLARLLLAQPEAREAIRELHVLLVGGEALEGGLASDLLATLSGTLINMYGPTETTIWSSTHTVEVPDEIVPIGRPILNTSYYVLDALLRPVPVGVVGELYIGGAGVARGYLDRPELTAERFVADPFGSSPADRLYRTGDLVRYRGDGVVEYVGRIDRQIKLRGHRIEPGEVEAVLRNHPAVREAAVIACRVGETENHLVGYYVPTEGKRPEPGDLRRFSTRMLSQAMVPAAFVEIPRLPLTPNGKVDYTALPRPDRAPLAAHAEFLPPRSSVERAVAALWSQVLGVARVGIDESFFEVGGDSLSAVRILLRIQETFGVRIRPGVLFDSPTVAGVARVVEKELLQRAASGELASVLKEIEALSDEELASALLPHAEGGSAG